MYRVADINLYIPTHPASRIQSQPPLAPRTMYKKSSPDACKASASRPETHSYAVHTISIKATTTRSTRSTIGNVIGSHLEQQLLQFPFLYKAKMAAKERIASRNASAKSPRSHATRAAVWQVQLFVTEVKRRTKRIAMATEEVTTR